VTLCVTSFGGEDLEKKGNETKMISERKDASKMRKSNNSPSCKSPHHVQLLLHA